MKHTVSDSEAFDRVAFDVAMVVSGVRTAVRLAKRIGFSRERVSLIRGGWIPPARLRNAIAKALGVAPAKLWPSSS